jgi:hypothetical protein
MEYKTKEGMLKYVIDVNKETFDNDGITITMTYDSYESGEEYKTCYKPEDISNIHKLFTLDPTLILDIIKNNELIKNITLGSGKMEVSYCTNFMNREYIICLSANKITHEGVDPEIYEIRLQNKILLRQVADLTNRLGDMESKFKKLSTCVANIGYGCDHQSKNIDLLRLVNINEIRHDKSNSYVENTALLKIHHKDNPEMLYILKNANLNISDENNTSLLSRMIIRISTPNPQAIEIAVENIHVMIESGADVNSRDNTGKTPLIYCNEKIKGLNNSMGLSKTNTKYYIDENLSPLNKLKSILLKAGAR